MKLSIIIVNFNVKYFLDQAIHSAIKSVEGIAAEIIVVDNNSSDNSAEYIQKKYPLIHIIHNKKNVGFSVANNQGIEISTGEFVLLLNPDTVVAEDTFSKCIQFMEAHPEAGGIGVKMLDGTGKFLPESKRAFPSPEVAFYKAFGLAALFPKSKIFGKYHLGYLDENTIHDVEVLAGAFMMLRRATLQKTGLFDEVFFMYGEDIDLSYRIVKAGYKNYYFPVTNIIHYKGESTKKGSLNYVRIFYNAMKVFACKHFSGRNAGAFVFLINIAIYFRAFLALITRFTRRMAWPITDAIIIFFSMLLIKEYWEYYVRYIEGGKYPGAYMLVNVPAYTLIWIGTLFFSGAYDKDTNAIRIIRGVFWGTILIAALYGFLPESLRFSRGMILGGAIFSASVLLGVRYLHHMFKTGNWRFGETKQQRILVLGSRKEFDRTQKILNDAGLGTYVVGYLTTETQDPTDLKCLGTLDSLQVLQKVFNCNELIFCAKDISYSAIINYIATSKGSAEFKINPIDSEVIIGSNSKDSAGDLYAVDMAVNITIPGYRRNKRTLDVTFAFIFLFIYPLLIFFVKNKKGFLNNIFKVFSGKYSWVGYIPVTNSQLNIPKIKPGILTPADRWNVPVFDGKTATQINYMYAKEYQVGFDIAVIFRAFKSL